jgi:hypothetical protein
MMPGKQINPGNKPLIHILPAPAPWEAALIPIESFPLNAEKNSSVISFLRIFSALLVKSLQLEHEVLLQVWKLGPGTGSEVIDEHGADWRPTLGIGIWPDRQAPRAWTDEAMSDAAAAIFRGDEIPLVSHKLLHLGVTRSSRLEAAHAMRGFGALTELFSRRSFEELTLQTRELYLPTIKEKRFRHARFYLPVLDTKSLAAAKDAEQLDRWTCGVEVYIRESAEDKGILILSRMPLNPILKQVAEQSSE